jgi:nitric oxide reductase NorQ protein
MNEGEKFTGVEDLDAALRDRFYYIQLEYLPHEIEKQVLVRKTGLSESGADRILNVINHIRTNEQAGVSVSIRHSLMIAELVSLGASLREALVYSLQISRDALESLLLSVHVQTHDTEAEFDRYVVYVPESSPATENVFQ